ncbi:broad-complex core protein isoforms 1/2/3/4/5-like isoform X2 [Neocloeon triangulifer]|uniref:broad-complex core protein isoforms 1/2/3/4/5-like isoform X2 n=1 Tax=Neocloeon triangulifer TaxID=2078957 RepID=UPI00286F04CC|nr:broad-complex core protein isoforms 1/2/3/4/5-like isoform X2 [Neocloeon triangulifer]
MEDTQYDYHLEWRNHSEQISHFLADIGHTKEFADVTLSCQGKSLVAHKIILSAFSPYLREIFKGITATKNQVVVLPELDYDDLKAIISCIYSGETTLPKGRLMSFLNTAKLLDIKGLASGSFLCENDSIDPSDLIFNSNLEPETERPEESPPDAHPRSPRRSKRLEMQSSSEVPTEKSKKPRNLRRRAENSSIIHHEDIPKSE